MRKLALEYLANAYGPDKLNDPAKAEPVYQEIVKLEPGEPANYVPLAKLYEDSGRYEEAEAQFSAITSALFILSLFINLGMWYERFTIFEPSLSHEFEPWQWTSYVPSWVDVSILVGSFGWFFMWFLLFIKQLPIVAMAEVKEIVPPRLRFAHAAEGVDTAGHHLPFAPETPGEHD